MAVRKLFNNKNKFFFCCLCFAWICPLDMVDAKYLSKSTH